MKTIYITGDTHGDPIQWLSSKKFPEGKHLTKDDYVIIAGDFGVIWKNIPDEKEEYILRWLKNKSFTTLFIDGNHENHDRLDQLPSVPMFGGTVGKVNNSVFHLKRGELYDIHGQKFFCFGGGESIDKLDRIPGVSWWEQELPSRAQIEHALDQLESVDYKVDYVVTHAPPRSVIGPLGFSDGGMKAVDPTTKFLDHIAQLIQCKKWYFGHMHVNKDLGKFKCLYHDIDEISLEN